MSAKPATVQTDPYYAQCPGCGKWFKGQHGLRAHQSNRFISMSCQPVRTGK